MTSRERQSALANRLEADLEYFRLEYDMTYAEVCGVLGILKADLELECLRMAESERAEDDDDSY